jgi:SAM-dependent methyltransferase
MSVLADHEQRNRTAWTRMSSSFEQPGRQSWESPLPHWGIWRVPESELGVLGDLSRFSGMDTIELGCGTGYVSAWLAKLGARPVGIDITPAQLEKARRFQQEFGIEFPLIEGSAEDVPLPNASFDLAISEYGASIWCQPEKWIAEASRLLRPGGELIFLVNGILAMLCSGEVGAAGDTLQRDWFGMRRFEWPDDESVEFHLTPGQMIRVLRENGFEVEALIDIQAPLGAPPNRFEYMTYEWARRWPSEEVWKARKRT